MKLFGKNKLLIISLLKKIVDEKTTTDNKANLNNVLILTQTISFQNT